MIEFRNLELSLENSKILHGVSATIPEGKLTALVGPNGAGKSTLLAALGRLAYPSEGEVLFDGRTLAQIGDEELAKRLSILRQDTRIATRLSVRDLVSFGRYPYSRGRLTDEDRAMVEASIRRVEMEDMADRFLDRLSGGQRQRALIAMALAQDTEALLLDEPLNNLDLSHARRVMKVARELADAGRTVAVVLHDLTIAARYADHVIALKKGKLHAAGTPDEVLTAECLSPLYDTHVEVYEIDGQRIVSPI